MLKAKKMKFLIAIILIDFLIVSLIFQMLNVDGEKIRYWYLILASSFFSFQAICALMPYFLEKKVLWDGGLILLLFSTTVYNFSVSEILGGVQYGLSDGKIFFFNIAIILTFITILYCIIGKIGITISITNMFFLVLGLINHYYYEFRGSPFEFADLVSAKTAMNVIGQYHFDIKKQVVIVLLMEIVQFLVIFAVLIKYNKRMSFLSKCIFVSCVLCGIAYVGVNMPQLSYWDISANSEDYGYIYSFVGYFKEMMITNKPENYEIDQVEEALEKCGLDGSGKSEEPDIIVIMNESFADLPAIYGFGTNEDVMPFIHTMSENTIKGNLLVSVYGGSTVNSEYEFLTGNSMAFMKGGSVPYVQYIRHRHQSIAHLLAKRGYNIIGYHPNGAKNYSRDKVYPLLGIEDFYSLEDEMPSNNYLRWCLSDQSDYENLIYIYEKNKEENSDVPLFLFNVTMQNHGGYDEKYEVDITVKPENEKLQTVPMNIYLSLIRESDRAFEQIINYFQDVERDVIVLMFGDHQPAMDTELFDDVTKMTQKHQTNFIIWANFDIDEKEGLFVSPNYLSSLLLKTAEVELSNWNRFLLKVMEEFPAINTMGYFDSEGNWNYRENKEELLQLYSQIQYYNAFDYKNTKANYFE